MSYFKKVIKRTGADRNSFKTQLANAIAALGSDFVLLTGNEIGVMIRDTYKLVFTNGYYSNGIKFSIYYNNTLYDCGNNFEVVNSSNSETSLTMTAAVNDNVINMKFKQVGVADPYFNMDLLFVFGTKNLFNVSYSSGNVRPFSTLADMYDVDAGARSVTSVNCLPYVYSSSSTNIEMTERKVFASGGIKQFEVLKMCDCSTVTGDQLFPINGKQYYAIDNNTLMEV